MKLTRAKLQQIIKEEFEKFLSTDWPPKKDSKVAQAFGHVAIPDKVTPKKPIQTKTDRVQDPCARVGTASKETPTFELDVYPKETNDALMKQALELYLDFHDRACKNFQGFHDPGQPEVLKHRLGTVELATALYHNPYSLTDNEIIKIIQDAWEEAATHYKGFDDTLGSAEISEESEKPEKPTKKPEEEPLRLPKATKRGVDRLRYGVKTGKWRKPIKET